MSTAILEETAEKTGQDLLSKLMVATEKKIPNINQAAKAWTFQDEPETEEIAPKGTETTATQPNNANQDQQNNEAKKPTKQELEASAESGATIVEFCSSIIFEGIVKVRFSRKFTDDEKQLLDEKVIDEAIENLTPEEQKLKRKYERLEKAKQRKLEEIETTDKQRKKMYDAFYKYSEVTGKTLGPGWIIGATIIDVVINKGIEAFTD